MAKVGYIDPEINALVKVYASDRTRIVFREMATRHNWGPYGQMHARRAMHALTGWKLNFPVGKETFWVKG